MLVVDNASRPHFKPIRRVNCIFLEKTWLETTVPNEMFKSSWGKFTEVQSPVWMLG
jgi:hypothetical protein